MSGKGNSKGHDRELYGTQKQNTGKQNAGKQQSVEGREVEELYRNLRRKRLPAGLAVIICVIVVLYGAATGLPSDRQSGQNGGSQAVQERQAGSQEIVYTFRSDEQLQDHFKKHGIEMGYEDEESYVEGANRVIASPDALHKLEKEDGDDVYYLEETNEFVILSTKGYIRTYFQPEDGLDYYNRQ